jgi:hypothetical protein
VNPFANNHNQCRTPVTNHHRELLVGRAETPVDPDLGPLQRFAYDLQVLRRRAGEPTYRAMGRRVGMSPSVLSEAAKGRRLPTLQATLAFVRACGEEAESGWHERWERTRAQLNQAPPRPRPKPSPVPKPRAAVTVMEPARRRWRWPLLVASLLVCAAATTFAIMRPGAADVGRPAVGPVADGDDPYIAGCGVDQKPLERQPIYWADGRNYGWVVLFYSASCSGAWGYVLGPNSPTWKINISAHRVDDNTEAPYSFQGEARPNSWGNALSTRTGCVRAEAWVDNGPRAVTSCWRPNGPVVAAAR